MRGSTSFSIYLSHILTIEVVELLWEVTGWPADDLASQLSFIILGFGISAFVGIAVYQRVEKPLLKHLRPLSPHRGH